MRQRSERSGLGKRRLFGLDRSGPLPSQTRPGEPLRPWTLPNLVGYLRLAAIPVFLWWALGAGEGPPVGAAILFALISAGDYADGLLARATGQYSRLGALLDPFVDRATILAGGYVCWHYELLPRWALAAVLAREVLTLAMAQVAIRRGYSIEINWFGRIAVFPIMGAIFLAMLLPSVAWDVMFIAGLGLAIFATFVYARGFRRWSANQPSSPA